MEDQRSDFPANRREPGSTRERPSFRHQAPMPAKQRRWRHDKGSPTYAREELAGRCEEDPVGPRHRRAAGLSTEDGEFVLKHDDFQLLKIVRPNAQGRKLPRPPKHQITDRENTKPSW